MKKKVIPTFSFLNNQSGGIFLSVMVILVMFTFMLVMVTENHFSKRLFLINTKDFYLARTIEELSLAEIESMDKGKPLFFEYNIGKVEINWNEQTQSYEVITQLDNQYKRISNKTIKR